MNINVLLYILYNSGKYSNIGYQCKKVSMSDLKQDWEEYARAFTFLADILNTPPNANITRKNKELFCGSDNPPMEINSHVGYQAIAAFFQNNMNVSIEKLVQDLAADWTRLFRGVSQRYGPPPPYEGVYRKKDEVGAEIILEVKRIYSEHGLSISDEGRDRFDYLGYELDFMKYLSEHVALAIERGQKKEEENYRDAFCRFMSQHLSTWVGDFCAQAAKYTQTPFYSGVLMLLEDTIANATAICNP
jgi:TorA maturation chaperone TorD